MIILQRTELSYCDEAASFLQSDFWGSFKARFRWEPLAFNVSWKDGADTQSKPLLVLCRKLMPGFSLAYIPWGPELPVFFAGDNERHAALWELAIALKKQLKRNTVFIRFDPPWYTEGAAASRLPRPFIRAGADIQPPDTVLLDLTQSLQAITEQMKPKWRYNARLAQKKGVTVRRAAAEEIDVFYELLKETARRDGIAIHSVDYYKALFAESNSVINPSLLIAHCSLYLAEHEGDLLAGIVTLFRGKEAIYLYGASSDKKRNLMVSYALQLKAIEDAKEAGCEVYDFFGIPPNDDPAHPMAGLYRFKTGFGGKIVHRSGSWDYPCRPLVYRLFRFAETLRKNLRTIGKLRKRKVGNATR